MVSAFVAFVVVAVVALTLAGVPASAAAFAAAARDGNTRGRAGGGRSLQVFESLFGGQDDGPEAAALKRLERANADLDGVLLDVKHRSEDLNLVDQEITVLREEMKELQT